MTKQVTPEKFYAGEANPFDAVNSQAVRAMQEVQAQVIMAKRFPRDIFTAEKRIIESCKRPSLASMAEYAYPRAGKIVRGPSIRLAEVIAQCWQNIDFGVREISNENGESVCESYAWDLETNVRQVKSFSVKHERKANGKIEKLSDPRDIYELVANYGARRLRACLLGIIPQDIVEVAVKACRETNSKDSNNPSIPFIDKIREMIKAFSGLSVSKEMIEKRISHSVDDIDAEELSELRAIFISLKDGMTKRSDWFEVEKEKSSLTESLNEVLRESEIVRAEHQGTKITPGQDENQSNIEIVESSLIEKEDATKSVKSPLSKDKLTFIL